MRKEELSSFSSVGWTQPPHQSMQRGNSHVYGESSQLHCDAAALEGTQRVSAVVLLNSADDCDIAPPYRMKWSLFFLNAPYHVPL